MQSDFGIGQADAQRLRHFLVIEAAEFTKDERSPVGPRKPSDLVTDECAHLLADKPLLRRGLRIGNRGVRAALALHDVRQLNRLFDLARRAAAQPIGRDIGRDPVNPGGKACCRGTAAKLWPLW